MPLFQTMCLELWTKTCTMSKNTGKRIENWHMLIWWYVQDKKVKRKMLQKRVMWIQGYVDNSRSTWPALSYRRWCTDFYFFLEFFLQSAFFQVLCWLVPKRRQKQGKIWERGRIINNNKLMSLKMENVKELWHWITLWSTELNWSSLFVTSFTIRSHNRVNKLLKYINEVIHNCPDLL